MKAKKRRLLPFRQAIPALLLYQLIAVSVTNLWMLGYSQLSKFLLHGTGRVAVSSGDYLFLFTTWQGILILLLSLITLFVFVALDINAAIILCGRLLKGEKPSVLLCIKNGILSLRCLCGPRGLLIVLYVSLLSPIINFGVKISLTENIYIPKFITSVIYENPLYATGVLVLFIAVVVIGLLFLFILHGALLDNMKLKDSAKQSARLVKQNWKNLLWKMILFSLIVFGITALIGMLIDLILFIPSLMHLSEMVKIAFDSAALLSGVLILSTLIMLMSSFYILFITELYLLYQSDGTWEYQQRENRKSPLIIAYVLLCVLVVIGGTVTSVFMGDGLLPSKVKPGYVAHRAGGVEAPENTVAGVQKAYELGAFGSEIDIQRTSDGYYVVNHDATFARVAGVNKKPSELTLAQVKELSVDGEPVPTLEEMLDASHNKVTLFIELKGDTADKQMADDTVRIIKEKNMTDETVIISLKYDLISHIETTYPEMNTGYLAFASFGDTAGLNCDYLALEEESATEKTIDSIHEKGKKVMVWTVNEADDIERFLRTDADAIITDSVALSEQIKTELEEQPLLQRLIFYLVDLL